MFFLLVLLLQEHDFMDNFIVCKILHQAFAVCIYMQIHTQQCLEVLKLTLELKDHQNK